MMDDDDLTETKILSDGSHMTICTEPGHELAVLYRYRPEFDSREPVQRWPDRDHSFDGQSREAFLTVYSVDVDRALCPICCLFEFLLCSGHPRPRKRKNRFNEAP